VPSNLIPIAALKKNWHDGESNPKILQHSAATFRLRRRSENRAQNVTFKHRIRSICLYRHCNALHFGNKHTVLSNKSIGKELA